MGTLYLFASLKALSNRNNAQMTARPAWNQPITLQEQYNTKQLSQLSTMRMHDYVHWLTFGMMRQADGLDVIWPWTKLRES